MKKLLIAAVAVAIVAPVAISYNKATKKTDTGAYYSGLITDSFERADMPLSAANGQGTADREMTSEEYSRLITSSFERAGVPIEAAGTPRPANRMAPPRDDAGLIADSFARAGMPVPENATMQ
jgi:hypothetical protein